MTTLVRQKSQSQAFRSHGVSLIEVMVTLVVVSVGVLGFASLQGQTQMAELQSAEYAYASRMVNSMAEQLRADADYGNKCLGSSYNSATTTPPTDMACATIAHVTTTSSINTWVGELSQSNVNSITVGGLPDPAGCIGFTAAVAADNMPAMYTIEVTWEGTNELAHVATDCAGSSASMRNSVMETMVIPDFLLPPPPSPPQDCTNPVYVTNNSVECSCATPAYAALNSAECNVCSNPIWAAANPDDCPMNCTGGDLNDCPNCLDLVLETAQVWNEYRDNDNDKALGTDRDSDPSDETKFPNLTSPPTGLVIVAGHVAKLTQNVAFTGNLMVEDLCLNGFTLTLTGSLSYEQYGNCHGNGDADAGAVTLTNPLSCVDPMIRSPHTHTPRAPINRD